LRRLQLLVGAHQLADQLLAGPNHETHGLFGKLQPVAGGM
jgi:hypothetical protein